MLSSKVVGTDDTPVKVLDRSLARTTRKGRFWPYLGDRNHEAAVFDYTPTRERAGPEQFLKHYRGYLQADAYVAYDSFFTDPERGLVEVACWAHTRRHFHQALDTDSARMGAVLAYIAHLYAGGETCAAVRHRGRGLAPVARASVPAGAREIARVSGEDSRRSVCPRAKPAKRSPTR